jgi:hypothetical protein
MKKILFVLLIAIIACSTVEEFDDVELQKFDPKAIADIWKKVKDVIDKAIKFLKENNLYDPLVALIKKYGTKYAYDLCVKQHKIEEATCKSIVDFLFGFLKKNKTN